MLYFHLNPNFQILSKYVQFPYSVELMEQYHIDGYDIVLDQIYTDEAVAEIENGFKLILNGYGLEDHYDNLFFLLLCKIQEHEAILDELYFQYTQKKRTKELASLLLTFAESPAKQYDALLLKTFKGTAKISDKPTIKWIGETIKQAILAGKMPLGDYEYRIMKDFFEETTDGLQLNSANLAIEAQKTILSPTNKVKSMYADICLHLYTYLNNETNIKPNADTLFSDAMLNFYFDLLELFGYINADSIASERKDYMGSLLKNRIKKLNPDYQGNKTK